MRRVGLVGLGSIGRFIVGSWSAESPRNTLLAAVCVRDHQAAEAERLVPPGVRVCTDIAGLLAQDVDVVIEAAGRDAAEAYGEEVLRAGKELYLLSVGILADGAVRSRLAAIARKSGGQMSIPAGALAGFDGLLALAKDGMRQVRYVSTKPLAAWTGTPAETILSQGGLEGPVVVFRGSAGEAARLYPKNANLAAAVALAGIGFERTEVELIADPHATGNSALLEAVGTVSRMTIHIQGAAAPGNPKTSAIVGASVLSALENSSAVIRFV